MRDIDTHKKFFKFLSKLHEKFKKVVLIGAEEDIIFELENSGHKIVGYFGNKKNTH